MGTAVQKPKTNSQCSTNRNAKRNEGCKKKYKSGSLPNHNNKNNKKLQLLKTL